MKHDAWERERTAREAGPDWMRALANQFRSARRRHPEDALMIVFDIDGTILDMRHMIRHVLIGYDCAHGADHFPGLNAEDIDVHENHVVASSPAWRCRRPSAAPSTPGTSSGVGPRSRSWRRTAPIAASWRSSAGSRCNPAPVWGSTPGAPSRCGRTPFARSTRWGGNTASPSTRTCWR